MTRDNPPANAPDGTGFVLEVDNLAVTFHGEEGALTVVDGVSFRVRPGKTLSVVGESGSGKSVTSLAVMGLLKFIGASVTARSLKLRDRNGEIIDLLSVSARRLRRLRGYEMAMIFQEPMTSLNPSHTVGQQIAEVLRIHKGMDKRQGHAAAIEMLERVGIPDAGRRVDAYPHEMSGGMRQRVMIAIALACSPSLMIADEPTTALDVTIQAQILEELKRLQDQFGMAMLFITHDLGVVAEIAHDVAVMYAGQVVEEGSVIEVLKHPRHPYTRGLLDSVPRPDRDREGKLRAIPGRVPDIRDLPKGCRFTPRCPYAEIGRCDVQVPELEVTEGQHRVRCVRWRELDLTP
jgi:oligopeptide/dipeptide ABC transporter ATP-binding protein